MPISTSAGSRNSGSRMKVAMSPKRGSHRAGDRLGEGLRSVVHFLSSRPEGSEAEETTANFVMPPI